MKELATYEHPGDYVVIPLPVRDRIMARLNVAESRVKELQNEIEEFKRKQAVKKRGHDVAEYYPPDGLSANDEGETT